MAVEPLKKLFWEMGLPMIVSMVLQALYNVVDSNFVANDEFKINKVIEMYGDTRDQAIEHIKKLNTARKTYYSLVANKVWGEKDNYNLYINANSTEEKIIEQIINYIRKHNK